jgi:hypothetical protein
MRKILSSLTILLLFALPARAETWFIGPSAGFDVYSADGESFLVVTAPSGTDVLFGGFRPGLRFGFWDGALRHGMFVETGLMSYTGSGFSLHAFSGTLNYAYAFHAGTSPYLTAGIGFANLGVDGNSDTATMYGFGVGGRYRLGHDHGGVRVEARFDRADAPQFVDPANIFGVRVGFDLDLN